jgi:hypothetical protein
MNDKTRERLGVKNTNISAYKNLFNNKIHLFSGLNSYLKKNLEGGTFDIVKPQFEEFVNSPHIKNILYEIFKGELNSDNINNINNEISYINLTLRLGKNDPIEFTNTFYEIFDSKKYCVAWHSISEHAISFVFKKNSNGTFNVALCNSGGECGLHGTHDFNVRGVLIFNNFTKDQMNTLLYGLYFIHSGSTFKIKQIYVILNMILELEERREFVLNKLYDRANDYLQMLPQRTGDCSYKAFILGYFAVIYFEHKSQITERTKNTMINTFFAASGLYSLYEIMEICISGTTPGILTNNFLNVIRENVNLFDTIIKRNNFNSSETNQISNNLKKILMCQYKYINLNPSYNNNYTVTNTNAKNISNDMALKFFNKNMSTIGTLITDDRLINFNNCLQITKEFYDKKIFDDQKTYIELFIDVLNKCFTFLEQNIGLEYGVMWRYFKTCVGRLPFIYMKNMNITNLINSIDDNTKHSYIVSIYTLMIHYKQILFGEHMSDIYMFTFAIILFRLMKNEIDIVNSKINEIETLLKPESIYIIKPDDEIPEDQQCTYYTIMRQQNVSKETKDELKTECKKVYNNILVNKYLPSCYAYSDIMEISELLTGCLIH